ncbi:hypothetical protein [Rhodanobacter sp. PCA2]|uniref:hypothetical protein n=1 Tax=Rhodanobacter sp. PCA2 TaxID=2006117 RepID=UPI0015E78502|nr:hypothetical protein [Rhodanobacter sp. PCA2]MBA2078386.1 hypothetical protein [Rhodanobacter sp. PCA2]
MLVQSSDETSRGLADAEVRAALAAAEDPSVDPVERAEMLVEIARGLQLKPRNPQQLHDAVTLYRRARALVPEGESLLAARTLAREGTAHQALPDGGAGSLQDALACFEAARPVLDELGLPEETAEVDLNLGLVAQSLAAAGLARIQDAISYYHRALKVFSETAFPREHAVVHNNLAIIYLSLPASDKAGELREAMAVQSFEQVLKVVNLVDHPVEYAMAQNNLGNALQYAPGGNRIANLLRAVEAYDEALKVRSSRDTPAEYANTIANKANALANLPDDPADPLSGQQRNLREARALYREAQALFVERGLPGHADAVADALAMLGDDAGHTPDSTALQGIQ